MAKLHIISGPMKGQVVDLQKETIFLGRSTKNDIRISDRALSRKQLKIFRIGGRYFVEDLKSTNGTWLNGNLILPGEGFELDEGDIISMGETQLRAQDLSASPFSVMPSKEKGKAKVERRQHPARYLEPLCRISELMRAASTEKEICFETLNSLLDHLPRIDRAAILIVGYGESEQNDLLLKSRIHEGDDHLALSRKVVEDVIKEGRAIRMSNTFYEAPADLSESLTLQIRCVICVPLLRNGRTLGALYIDSLRMPHGFRKEDLLLLKGLSGPIALLVEHGWEMGNWSTDERQAASDTNGFTP
jgi:pSer/pThr/pTyr-binding forkhead associated (FHA) protein